MDSSSSSSMLERGRTRTRTRTDHSSNSNSEDDAAVRSALHFAVGRICEAEEDDEFDLGGQARMSSTAVAALTELVYQYATTSLANDLVAFSKHARRKTVNVDDVRLMVRKDGQVLDLLNKFIEREGLGTAASSSSAAAAAAGRKRKGSGSNNKATTKVAGKKGSKQSWGRQSKTSSSASKKKRGASASRKQKESDARRQKMMEQINASSSSSSCSDESSSDDDAIGENRGTFGTTGVRGGGKSRMQDISDGNFSPMHNPTRDRSRTADKVSRGGGGGGKKKSDTEEDNVDGDDDMAIDLISD